MATTKINEPSVYLLKKVQKEISDLKDKKKEYFNRENSIKVEINRELKYKTLKMNLDNTPLNRRLGLVLDDD